MGAQEAADSDDDRHVSVNDGAFLDKWSLAVTLLLVAASSVAAWVGHETGEVLLLALSLGALGGLVHELAQSHGKIVFMEKAEDGLYLGAVTGMVLGAVAGALAVQSDLPAIDPSGSTLVRVGYSSFLAGLALKGVTEAAIGEKVDKRPELPEPQIPVDPPVVPDTPVTGDGE